MRHPTYEDIQDLADGMLAEAPAERIREHLESCDGCRGELAGVERLKELAAGLAVGADPPEAEWERIEAHIRGTIRPLSVRSAAAVARDAPIVSLRRAAGWVLVALGIGGGAVALTSRGGRAPAPAPGIAYAEPAESVDDAYAQSVYDLEVIFAEGASELEPETLAVIEENLELIEEAVERARAEIEADPGSVALARSLSSLYGAKVRVLSAAVALADTR